MSAKIDRTMALEPDLVIGFSDLQADIAADLIKQGANVLLLKVCSVEDILNMILMLTALLGATYKGAELVADLSQKVTTIHRVANETAG